MDGVRSQEWLAWTDRVNDRFGQGDRRMTARQKVRAHASFFLPSRVPTSLRRCAYHVTMSEDLPSSEGDPASEHLPEREPGEDSPDRAETPVPLSSPPRIETEEPTQSGESVAKKRSHVEAVFTVEEPALSSATMSGEAGTQYSTAREMIPPSTAAHHNLSPPSSMFASSGTVEPSTMLPPKRPASSMLASQKVPTSAQRLAKTEPASLQPAQPQPDPKADRPFNDMLSEENEEGESDSTSDSADVPEEAIDEFDWQDLQHRYHERMKELNYEEQRVMEHFQSLIEVRLFVSSLVTVLTICSTLGSGQGKAVNARSNEAGRGMRLLK